MPLDSHTLMTPENSASTLESAITVGAAAHKLHTCVHELLMVLVLNLVAVHLSPYLTASATCCDRPTSGPSNDVSTKSLHSDLPPIRSTIFTLPSCRSSLIYQSVWGHPHAIVLPLDNAVQDRHCFDIVRIKLNDATDLRLVFTLEHVSAPPLLSLRPRNRESISTHLGSHIFGAVVTQPTIAWLLLEP